MDWQDIIIQIVDDLGYAVTYGSWATMHVVKPMDDGSFVYPYVKIGLAHIEPKGEILLWTVYHTSYYKNYATHISVSDIDIVEKMTNYFKDALK